MNYKTTDEMDEKYNPDTTVKSEHFTDGRLETFGNDFEQVNILARSGNITRIWTCVEGDDGQIMFVTGVHYVNRLYYYVTKEHWENENEFYVECD